MSMLIVVLCCHFVIVDVLLFGGMLKNMLRF